MAMPISAALFGVDTSGLENQRFQQDMNTGLNLAALNPFSVPTATGYAAGAQLGRGIGQAFGAQDPELMEASAAKATASQMQQEGLNLQSYAGLSEFAKRLASQGFHRSAMLAGQAAQELQKAGLEAEKTQSEIAKNQRVDPKDANLAAIRAEFINRFGPVEGERGFNAYLNRLEQQRLTNDTRRLDHEGRRLGIDEQRLGYEERRIGLEQRRIEEDARQADQSAGLRQREQEFKEGEPQRKQERIANDALLIIDEIEPLLSKATSSRAGNVRDTVLGAFGASTEQGNAAAQLASLGGRLVSAMPRMEGPQSDKDTQLYREMAGRLGDPNVPEGQKRAALKTIRELNEKYAGVQPKPAGAENLPRVTSENHFKSLPSGTIFIDPNGVTRRKP